MLTATIGRRWSSDRITSRPFGRVYFSNLIFGTEIALAAGAPELWDFTGAFFGGAFVGGFWAETAMTANITDKLSRNHRRHNQRTMGVLLSGRLNLYTDARRDGKDSPSPRRLYDRCVAGRIGTFRSLCPCAQGKAVELPGDSFHAQRPGLSLYCRFAAARAAGAKSAEEQPLTSS